MMMEYFKYLLIQSNSRIGFIHVMRRNTFMRVTKKVKMNIWMFSTVFLLTFALLTSNASASPVKIANDDHDKNVREEIVGITDDAKDFLVKRTIVHYKDQKSKPGNGASSVGAGCYKLMGVKWKSFPVTYVINTTNPLGLTEENITTAFSTSAETWDASTSRELFADTYTVDSTARYNGNDPRPDGRNSLVFGDNEADYNVIAVTSIWYTLFGRQIVDFDISFETNFGWGNADPSKMDLQNIATHELGHGIGLSDLYNSCVDETMYGYSSNGETKKRDLNAGDIVGLQRMYGS